MKPILQYGSLAGWPYRLAEGLRQLGVPSESVIPDGKDWADLDRRLPFHSAIYGTRTPRAAKILRRGLFLAAIPSRYSLVHYHASHLFRGTKHHLLEGPYLSSRGVPMVISFSGSDARIISAARANNPYFHLDLDEARDQRSRAYLHSLSRTIRFAATDCEMAEYVAPYFDKVFTFRQPVDLDAMRFVGVNSERLPILLHVPTDTHVKGTEYVVRAVEQLRQEGHRFEFRMKRQLTQSDFYTELRECDVYIDELRCGSHGVTAVEAMALGKPTITYIRPDLIQKYPAGMPLVNANPDTITDALRRLIVDPDTRSSLSKASRDYVERYHDAKVVAQDMLGAYRAAGLTHSRDV